MVTRNGRVFFLACAMAASAAVAAFGSGSDRAAPADGSYADMSPAQLAGLGSGIFLVNTHVPYAGEIAGTKAFIPYNETASRLSQFPADKDVKIVLYCRSGRMSEIAARALALAGYTNVFNLSGGMIAWEKAGFKILDKRQGKSERGS